MTRQRSQFRRGGIPKLTAVLIAINALFWLIEISPFGDTFITYLAYKPVFTAIAPWQMLTGAFLHDWNSPIHLLFNMYTLFIFGQVIEPMLGKGRYLALYLISAFGGSVAVLVFGDPAATVVGASGAIYGLMGAYFILLRAIGQPSGSLMGLIAINLVFSFMNQGISWQAHIGGLFVGAAIAGVYAATRRAQQKSMQIFGLAGIVVVLLALTLYQVSVYKLF